MGLFDKFPYSNSHQLNLDWIIRIVKTTIENAVLSINGKTGEVRLTAEDVNALPDTVTTLPNPHKLTFTGGATGTYDGSAPVTINVEGGSAGVASVNGKTGVVTLTADDVGAIPNVASSVTNTNLSNGSVTLNKMGNFGSENNGKRLAVQSDGSIGLASGEGPASGVESVNGKDGVVVLTAEDVGAIPKPINAVEDFTVLTHYRPTGVSRYSRIDDRYITSVGYAGGISVGKIYDTTAGKIIKTSTTPTDGRYKLETGGINASDFNNAGTAQANKVLGVNSDGSVGWVAGGGGSSNVRVKRYANRTGWESIGGHYTLTISDASILGHETPIVDVDANKANPSEARNILNLYSHVYGCATITEGLVMYSDMNIETPLTFTVVYVGG